MEISFVIFAMVLVILLTHQYRVESSYGCGLEYDLNLTRSAMNATLCELVISVKTGQEIICTQINMTSWNWVESGVWPVVDVVSCSSSLRPLIPAGFPGLLDREPRRHILQAGSGCHGALSECVSGWWAVELPGPLCKEQCIEVRLGESRVGSGTVVPAFSEVFYSGKREVEGCPSNVTGERVVWYDRTGSMAALGIAAIQERYGGAKVTLRTRGDSYFLVFSENVNASNLTTWSRNVSLPQRLRVNGSSWSWVKGTGTENLNDTELEVTAVHLISDREVYLETNNGLLYTADRGMTLYQMTLGSAGPRRVVELAISQPLYACLFTSTLGVELVVGVVGSVEFVEVYPAALFSRLVGLGVWSWPQQLEPLHTSLSFSHQHKLFLNQNGSSYEVPLPLLIPYQLNPSQLRYNDLCEGGVSSLADSSHPREVFQPGPSQLTFCPGRCSFSFLSLCSNSCALFTRSRLSVHGPRLLLEETQPLGQCNSQGTLPHDIFLGKKDSCKFLVEIRVADLVEDGPWYLVWVSEPDLIEVNVSETNSTSQDGSNVAYEVSIQETGTFDALFPVSFVVSTVVLDFRVHRGVLECVHPLKGLQLDLTSQQLQVHIGCPPGQALRFSGTPLAPGNYYCPSSPSISCYNYARRKSSQELAIQSLLNQQLLNTGSVHAVTCQWKSRTRQFIDTGKSINGGFVPSFTIYDDVLDTSTEYVGEYTLLVIAGGWSLESMTKFGEDGVTGIDSDIWVSTSGSNGPVYHTGSEFRWTCGSRSPCGESVPGIRGTHYYLHFNVTNTGLVGSNWSYCNLTTDFYLVIGTLPMGPFTALLVLLLWHVLLVFVMMVVLLVWLCLQRCPSHCSIKNPPLIPLRKKKLTFSHDMDWLLDEIDGKRLQPPALQPTQSSHRRLRRSVPAINLTDQELSELAQ